MAFFNEEDRQHSKALAVFERIRQEKLSVKISCITIVEMVSLMKYRKIKNWQKYARKLIDGSFFLVDNTYSFTPNDLSWKLTLREENIGMVDAIEIEYCLKDKTELITFNKNQEKVWKKLRNKK